MVSYTRELIVNILSYNEEIRALVERTAGHPQASIYRPPAAPSLAEGKTLLDFGPKTTRVTATHGLKEQLLDMLVDVDMARKKLTEFENACLGLTYIIRPIGRPIKGVRETADSALEKIVAILNGLPYDSTEIVWEDVP